MRRVLAVCLHLTFSVALALAGVGVVLASQPSRTRPDEVVVRVRADVSLEKGLDAVVKSGKSLTVLDRRLLATGPSGSSNGKESAGGERTWLLRLAPGSDVVDAINALGHEPGVLFAEANYVGSLCVVPTDPFYPNSSSDFAVVGAEQAWDVQHGADSSVTVAVIDSGVDGYHEDLSATLDFVHSYNFPDGSSVVSDDIGHGTRVAGLIGAAAENGVGLAGLAHGCRLVSLDVATPSGQVALSDVIAAITAAVVADADVINMSLGFDIDCQTLEATCADALHAGVVLVASAGNEGRADAMVYPAGYDSVIGVGAVTDDGVTRATWSNYNGAGGALVELVAPGVTLFSTIPGSQYDGLYGSGTSFAAPIVSAAAALLKAQHPEMSAGAIRDHLSETARERG